MMAVTGMIHGQETVEVLTQTVSVLTLTAALAEEVSHGHLSIVLEMAATGMMNILGGVATTMTMISLQLSNAQPAGPQLQSFKESRNPIQ